MALDLDESGFCRLVMLAQSAGLDQRKWCWFLQELNAVTGARVQLFAHDIRTGQPLGFYEYGGDPVFLRRYVEHYGRLNAWIAGFSGLSPGKAVLGREIIPDSALERTEFYNDWVRPQEDMIGGVACVLEVQSDRVTAIAANVRRADRARSEAEIRDLLQRLTPHLQESLKVSRQLGHLTLENIVLRTGTDPGIASIFVLDPAGRIRYANRCGEALAERGEIVRVDAVSRLRFTEPAANSHLARSLHEHARIAEGVDIALPFVIEGVFRQRYVCRAMPISAQDGPYPWLGPIGDSGGAFTLVILSSIAPSVRQSPRETSLG